jgi:hypothetical protein
VRRQEQAETTENETGYWRVALLAYDLAGRTLTDEQVDSSIRRVDSLLQLRQDCISRGDTQTVKFLDMSIHRRCEDVDQGSLDSFDRAQEHLERYDAAQSADPS